MRSEEALPLQSIAGRLRTIMQHHWRNAIFQLEPRGLADKAPLAVFLATVPAIAMVTVCGAVTIPYSSVPTKTLTSPTVKSMPW